MTISKDFPVGYVEVCTIESWQELVYARGYAIESDQEFDTVEAINDLNEVGGEWDFGEESGWVA